MRRLIIAVLLAGAVLSTNRLFGQSASFYIENIEVRGLANVSSSIIVSESRLHPGETYSEAEIHDANNRIRRLPFVFGCDFSLEKGSVRDRYVLVITVTETRPWFFQLGGSVFDRGDDLETLDAGHRWFFGTTNEGYVAFGRSSDGHGQVDAGFNHYNLFGRGGLLNFNLRKSSDSDVDLSPSLTLTVPTHGNDAIRLLASYASAQHRHGLGDCCPGIEGQSFAYHAAIADLSWIRDDTDDPFFPVEGMLATAGLSFTDQSDPVIVFQNDGSGYLVDHISAQRGAAHLSVAKFWPVFTQGSIQTEVSGAVQRAFNQETYPQLGDATRSSTSHEEELRLGYSDSFWSPEHTQRDGYFRWQVFADLAHYDPSTVGSYDELYLGWGIAFRNSWGLVRLQYFYEVWSHGGGALPTPDASSALPFASTGAWR